LLLAIVIVLSAAYLTITVERRTRSIASAAQAFDTRVATAIRQTFDLRSAQQGYVSQGQQERFWMPKVGAAISAVRESLTSLQASSSAAASRVALDGAQQALQEFERMDKRAREHIEEHQKLAASDLIFSDGLDTTEEIITALEQTRYVEAADAAGAIKSAKSNQATVLGAAALIALLVILLLAPSPPSEQPLSAAIPASAASSTVASSPLAADAEEFEFRLLARPAASPPPELEPSLPPLESASPSQPVSVPDLAPEIENVAQVCRELARLADTTALPPLLERAATALEASGVMLWVADPDARELTAVASHGYPKHILSRIGTIGRDAENVTAAAFRTGLLQTLGGDAASSAAIAAPLVNPSGCIGVMSAEVGLDAERHPARLAFATIVAAQLATLVAPAARVHSKSEAV
jgi:hypothetical protein